MSGCLFEPHDSKFVNVFLGMLLLGIVLNGEEGKGAELLEGKSMGTNEVIN